MKGTDWSKDTIGIDSNKEKDVGKKDSYKKMWEDLLTGYNRMYGSSFTTIKEMLAFLYQKEKSGDRVGDILGISGTAVIRKMKKCGIPIGPRGGIRYSKCLQEVIKIPMAELEQMTVRDIAKKVGYSKLSVAELLCHMGINYKKLKNQSGAIR